MASNVDQHGSAVCLRRVLQPELEQSQQISLEPFAAPPWHRRMLTISFGVSTELFPYINSHKVVRQAALPLVGGETYLFVAKLAVGEQGVSPYLRVFRRDEPVDDAKPSVWTIVGTSASVSFEADSTRLKQRIRRLAPVASPRVRTQRVRW